MIETVKKIFRQNLLKDDKILKVTIIFVWKNKNNYISSFLLFFISIFFHLCKFKKSFVIENYPTPTWRWHPDFFDFRYDVDWVLDPAEFYLFIDLGVFSLSYNLFSLFVYDVKTLKDDLFENEEVFGRLDEKKPDWLGLKGTSWN